ncbi:MAG: cytochrome c peroxidase [Planctomycetaceae bacterium]|jgi:cytochrome c peroxidase
MKSVLGVLGACGLLGWMLVVATAAQTCPQCQTSHGPRYCPATPLTKQQILPNPPEGCERQQLQDLELNMKGTLSESRRLVAEAQRCQPFWTPQRRKSAAAECILSEADSVCRTDQVVADQRALVALGKAWFWEQRVGSDGQTACASCHYRAGADARDKSLGVAMRAFGPFTDPRILYRADGSEYSVPYEDSLGILYLENRWGGMIDFSKFYREQSARALHQASRRIDESGQTMSESDRTNLNTELHRVQLTGSDAACREAWQGVEQRLAHPASGTGLPEVSLEGIRTLIDLGNSGLILANQAVEVGSTNLTASRQEARRKLGQSIARYESQLASGQQAAAAAADNSRAVEGGDFLVRGTSQRNAPTVVNAALHDRLFHDGRATSVFNGYDHLGDDAGRDGVGKWVCRNGVWRRVLVRIPNAALASQATAPLLSTEMSWYGRQYHHVARKLLNHTPRPLADQWVSCTDSVLGPYVTPQPGSQLGKGLNVSYRDLIRRAFRPEFCSDLLVPCGGEHDAPTGTEPRLTQTEANFSLFWGLAVMAYEQTLISDQSEFDQLLDKMRRGLPQYEDRLHQSTEKDQRTKLLLQGFKAFREHACADCHHLPEFAGATQATLYGPILEFEGPLDAVNADNETNEFVNWLQRREKGCVEPVLVESMFFRPNLAARLYDSGFYNLSVTADTPGEGFDPGNAGEVRIDLTNQSEAIQSVANCFGQGLFTELLNRPVPLTYSLSRRNDPARSIAMGSFKTSTLRNIALTPPYFHDGSDQNLAMVLEHYERPLNNREEQNAFIHPALLPAEPYTTQPLTAIPDSQRPAVIELMKSLTDPRVAQSLPPFDHPTLSIPTKPRVNATTGRTNAQDMVPIEQVQPQP